MLYKCMVWTVVDRYRRYMLPAYHCLPANSGVGSPISHQSRFGLVVTDNGVAPYFTLIYTG